MQIGKPRPQEWLTQAEWQGQPYRSPVSTLLFKLASMRHWGTLPGRQQERVWRDPRSLLLQSQQVVVVRPRGIFVFAIPPRRSKPTNPCSGPCSLYNHGEQLGGGKFSRSASGAWDFCRGLQGVRCDSSEPDVTGTLKFHEH